MRTLILCNILVILFFIVSPCAMGLPLELIVLVDTSNSMEQYFDDLVNYIITDILKKNLHPGDTFHLIRFSEYPVHELTQIIPDERYVSSDDPTAREESTDAILKKISFLKKKLFFGKYTDILAALQYVILYAEGLSKRHNKKLIMLSDFINNPAPESQYAGISLDELERELALQAKTIREREGWSIRFVRFPDQTRETKDQTGNIDESADDDIKDDIIRDTDDDDVRDITRDTVNDSDTVSDTFSIIERGTETDSEEDRTRDQDKDSSTDREMDKERDHDSDNDSPVRPEDITATDNKDITNTTTSTKERGTETETRGQDKEQDVVDIISDTFDTDIPTFDTTEKDDLSYKTTGFPRLEFPGHLGKKGRVFQVPFVIHNYLDDTIVIKLKTLEYAGKNIIHKKVDQKFVGPHDRKPLKVTIKLPPDIPEGPCSLPISLSFDDDYRVSPRQGILTFTYTGDMWVGFFNFMGENLTIIITILIIILISLLIFIFIRMRVFEGVFSDLLPAPEWRGTAAGIPSDGEKLIEMRVSFQNPHIGFRNIHKIEPDKTLTVGGGFSSFLIFLIPMPTHIGEITNIDGTYVFTPVKEEFFPDLKGPVENCLKKEIPVVSQHGYRTMITFIEYESPLTRINNLLHSAQHGE